ncbi:MAG: hypothetical protein ACJ735_00720 [Actinomycetes bacterium]
MLQVLVDADNVPAARLQVLAAALTPYADALRLVVAGRSDVVRAATWPVTPELAVAEGWQRADLALAAAYSPIDGPLVLASGDSDFVQLATNHPGPVLVVSEAAAARYRDVATVVDPVHEPGALQQWLAAVQSD